MTEALLNMCADEFLDALCKDTNVEAIVVGENFTFGAKGLGNPEYMKQVLADKAIQVFSSAFYCLVMDLVLLFRVLKLEKLFEKAV